MALKAIFDADKSESEPRSDLFQRLQWEQFKHDESYHREIARLSVQDRLKHMALHFAKYAGEIFNAPSPEEYKRLVTDSIIIAISTCNILNLRVSDLLDVRQSMSNVQFEAALLTAAGRMAAACEKMDHLEDFSYRPVIREQISAILVVGLQVFANRGWDISQTIDARLQPVKAKSIFFNELSQG